MTVTIKLFGPPGTGKTTTLLRTIQGLLDRYDSREIAFVSFTRAAIGEARERVFDSGSLDDHDVPWWRTIHSMCYRLLGVAHNSLAENHLGQFAKGTAWAFRNLGHNNPEDWTPRENNDAILLGDLMMGLYDWQRNSMLSEEDAFQRYENERIEQPGIETFRIFRAQYEAWKAEKGFVDFGDLLTRCMVQRLAPPVKVLVVDECQDLSPLQWALVDAWGEACEVVYLAGDDDQAIFSFQGANANLFIDHEGREEVLGKSYRLPSTVHELAQRTIRQVAKRQDKAFMPRATGGAVDTVDCLDNVANLGNGGSWFILARNRFLLEGITEHLEARGLLYHNLRGSDPQSKGSEVTPVVASYRLADGGTITMDEWRRVLDVIPSGYQVLKHGCKEIVKRAAKKHPDQPLSLGELAAYGATKRLLASFRSSEPLQCLEKIPYPRRALYANAVDKHGAASLLLPPAVTIGTIHSVKGSEADHVVLLTDMARATWRAYDRDPDTEHRCFYVGMTRARQSLTIVQPQTRLAYLMA